MLITPRLRTSLRAPLLALIASAALFAGLLPATVAPTSVAHAAEVESVSISPAGQDGAEDSRSRFDYQASPGQRLDDSVRVTNTGTARQDIVVFATDAFNTFAGDFSLLDTGVEATDSGNWITLDGQKQLTVSLDPGASQVIPFAVDVPADARPGDHAAGIVASVQKGSDQILVDRRVATRLYVRVPGELQPGLTITSFTASYDGLFNPFDGSATITYTVENTGNVALGATTAVGSRTWFGIGVGPVSHPEVGELLPGNRREVTETVTGLAQWGFLNPYVTLQPVTVDTNALQVGPIAQVNRDTFVPAIPWWLLILVLVAGAVYLFVRLSRRSDEKRAQAWLAYNEEQARERARDELVGAGAGAGAGARHGQSDPEGRPRA